MSAPFTFITRHRVAAEHRDELIAAGEEYSAYLERHEPSLLALSMSFDDDRAELTLVHVLTDAEAGDAHMRLAHEHIGRGLDLVETAGLEVHGRPGPVISGAITANRDAGVPVSLSTEVLGGFARARRLEHSR